jgi:hypothetical protein
MAWQSQKKMSIELLVSFRLESHETSYKKRLPEVTGVKPPRSFFELIGGLSIFSSLLQVSKSKDKLLVRIRRQNLKGGQRHE